VFICHEIYEVIVFLLNFFVAFVIFVVKQFKKLLENWITQKNILDLNPEI